MNSECLPDGSPISNVFLGRALDKQDKNDEAERAYNLAVKTKENDPLVWQGLITLYEKQAGKKIDGYHIAALRLAECFMTMYVAVMKKFWRIGKTHN